MANPFSDILNEKAINDLAAKARSRAEAIHGLFVSERSTASAMAFRAKEAETLAKRMESEFLSALKRAEAEARAEARAEADREAEAEARAEARAASKPEPKPEPTKPEARTVSA
jgi:hypothetical protein